MKTYEMIERLKQEVRWLSTKHGAWESRVGNLEQNLRKVEKYHAIVIKDLKDELKIVEDTSAQIFDALNAKKQELHKFVSKKTTIRKPSKPRPEVNGNGKIICDICKEEYSKQGYPSHRKKCERIKTIQDELKALEEV